MRSSRELVLLVALAACGNDSQARPDAFDDRRCETTFVDYATFGRPFLLDWCTGCHSSSLPPLMRQGSPPDVNFDDHAAALRWGERIRARAVVGEDGEAPTMPPAGGPSEEERQLLAEWVDCGMK